MTTRSTTATTSERTGIAGNTSAAINEVLLVGRLSQPAEERVLPSGDILTTFRLVVDRLDQDGTERRSGGRRSVDTLDCAVWTGRLRRTVGAWQADDVVEVRGAVRRRFFRAGAGVASRVEIEVSGARRLRRPATG